MVEARLAVLFPVLVVLFVVIASITREISLRIYLFILFQCWFFFPGVNS